MEIIISCVQVVIALALLNVWLVRFRKPTPYRGGNAKNMKEEFAAYGLPTPLVSVIGALKVGFAIALIAGLWAPPLTRPAAMGVAALMLGATLMHFKIQDPVKKSLPAMTLFLLAAIVALAS